MIICSDVIVYLFNLSVPAAGCQMWCKTEAPELFIVVFLGSDTVGPVTYTVIYM